MSWYFKITSTVGKVLYPSLLWNFPRKEKILYLTFDDGPIPIVTPWVLSLLKEFEAKATFFCTGDNNQKHPEIFRQIISEGHSVGNHTYHHLNGWRTSTDLYLENVALAEEVFYKNQKKSDVREDFRETKKGKPGRIQEQFSTTSSGSNIQQEKQLSPNARLFRPPYGRLKNLQIKKLKKLNYTIVMWDIITGDFDKNLSTEKCYEIVARYAKPGSIIVFHDSLKAEKNLRKVLPKVLKEYSKSGYIFKAI